MPGPTPPRSSAPPPPPPTPTSGDEVPVGRMSPSLSHFAPAFVQVQMKLRPVIKRSENPHFKSTFANLGDILEEALPVLGDHGFGLAQFPTTDERGGLALLSMLIHESGQYVAATMPLMVVKQDPQGEGSAISYGRRYAACAILGIRTADDDGNEASGRSERPARQERQAPQEQSKEQKLGWADADACKAAHDAVGAQIKALFATIPEDAPMRRAIREHRDNNGWPMVPDALSALSMMVAKATPAAQDGQEGAGGSQSAPEATTPAPEAPTASEGEVCWYCEKPMKKGEPTVIIGGQDADHPAQRMHSVCKAERDAELEEEGRPFDA
jgi:hypothetical protein